jgi:predicted nucleotidyltransferase
MDLHDADLPIPPDELRAALRAHGVVFAFVFGSRARGEHHPDSDLDVAAMGDGPLPRPWAILPEGVDVVDLATAPEWLAGRVAMDGILLLDDDPPARVRWLADTRKRHLDEAPRRARWTEDFVASRG